jgi:hypothetical protein
MNNKELAVHCLIEAASILNEKIGATHVKITKGLNDLIEDQISKCDNVIKISDFDDEFEKFRKEKCSKKPSDHIDGRAKAKNEAAAECYLRAAELLDESYDYYDLY